MMMFMMIPLWAIPYQFKDGLERQKVNQTVTTFVHILKVMSNANLSINIKHCRFIDFKIGYPSSVLHCNI